MKEGVPVPVKKSEEAKYGYDQHLNDNMLPFGVYPKATKKLVIYNRMSKCGSSTMLYLLGQLRIRAKFNLIRSTLYGEKNHQLDKEGLGEYVKSFQNLTTNKVIFERHIYFMDFEKFGYRQPIYFNIIRDPFERTLSRFYYQFTRLNSRKNKRIEFYKTHSKNETFEKCIRDNLNSSSLVTKCMLVDYDDYVRWFCGHENECANVDYGLAKAKYNIEKYYMLIGLTEEYTHTVHALEMLLPSYFKGMVQFYIQSKKKQNATPSSRKKRPSNEIIQFIKNRYKNSYEIYNFVKQKFYLTIRSLGLNV
ncbi:unnamed protein product [Owenia fusiformis]|uniref:Uncharacterized protein n=1 Tax=Owenia fusiformis TaxID=6347 RepID=A0A8J1XJX1_OWEFU|nr:unnamed protein product [Owenia fusiformis]